MQLYLPLICVLALTGAYAADSCYKDVNEDCSSASTTMNILSCNAKYGEFGNKENNVPGELYAYANLHLERSYQYLLSYVYFNNYQTNREGFGKLFKKLSDDAWGKTIGLIKHVTKRGGQMDFARRPTNYTVELHELESIAKALDTQKELAERAFHIHREATKHNDKLHDPEIAQYLEEEFIEDHSETIRRLAGHASDLKKFIGDNKGQDLSLALYLYDEYLQKTVS